MRSSVFILVMMSAVCASVSVPAAADNLLVSYELSEINLTITSPDSGVTTLQSVQGGNSGAPAATEGQLVLECKNDVSNVLLDGKRFPFEQRDRRIILSYQHISTQENLNITFE